MILKVTNKTYLVDNLRETVSNKSVNLDYTIHLNNSNNISNLSELRNELDGETIEFYRDIKDTKPFLVKNNIIIKNVERNFATFDDIIIVNFYEQQTILEEAFPNEQTNI